MKNKLQVFNKYALSTMAIQLLALGKANGWHFQSLGKAPIPADPIHLDGWVLIPAEQDTHPIPNRTKNRIRTVYASGIRPQAWVLIHEAPALLPAPNQRKASGTLAQVFGLLTLGSLLSMLVMTAAVVDPILVAITPEGEWIEIDRWID
ncbi:MAG: hypothetical protein RQ728_10340 [Brevefilum sp.]|nr:hypothetical protein [Brevefilum sp.]